MPESTARFTLGDACLRPEHATPHDPHEARLKPDRLGITMPVTRRLHHFGLIPARHSGAHRVDLPVVESIRTMRRIGPDNSVNFDLVAEVTQRRKTERGRWFYGGSTIIVGADGRIRYSVVKHVDSARRLAIFSDYLKRSDGEHRQVFQQDKPSAASLLKGLHANARR